MRALMMAAGITMLTAAPLMAQPQPQPPRGFVTGVGGFAVTPDTTSGAVLIEGGVRVAPRLMIFGNVGQFHNLLPSDAEPTVETTVSTLSTTAGVDVTGSARVPAWYSVGGLRFEIPAYHRVSPYVLGGIGGARLTPTGHFTYSSGTLPDGTTPAAGADITSTLVTAGYFTAPPASNAFMFTLGGGVDLPVAAHWAVDVGYRFSRLEADAPLNTQGATFGFGYRF